MIQLAWLNKYRGTKIGEITIIDEEYTFKFAELEREGITPTERALLERVAAKYRKMLDEAATTVSHHYAPTVEHDVYQRLLIGLPKRYGLKVLYEDEIPYDPDVVY